MFMAGLVLLLNIGRIPLECPLAAIPLDHTLIDTPYKRGIVDHKFVKKSWA